MLLRQVPSDEARALYDWLKAAPGVRLELLDIVSISNGEAAAFVVRGAPPRAECPAPLTSGSR